MTIGLARRALDKARNCGGAGFTMLIVAGLIALPFGSSPVRPDAATWLGLAAASVAGIGAYTSLTIAMRTGEVGAVTPFRYTRLVFAMIAGVAVFGERPDLWTVIGSTLIILAGITASRHCGLTAGPEQPHDRLKPIWLRDRQDQTGFTASEGKGKRPVRAPRADVEARTLNSDVTNATNAEVFS